MNNEVTKQQEALVKATLSQDWGRTNDQVKVRFIAHLCNQLSIPAVMNPFIFIKTKNGQKLYTPSEGAYLIASKNRISTKIKDRSYDKERQIYSVTVECSTPDGRTSEDIGHMFLGGLQGENLANAMMKAETKAKRRAILSTVGLSVLTEDAIPYVTSDSVVRPGEVEIVDALSEPVEDYQEDKAYVFERMVKMFDGSIEDAMKWCREEMKKDFDSLDELEIQSLDTKLDELEEEND